MGNTITDNSQTVRWATSWPGVRRICFDVGITFNDQQCRILERALSYDRVEPGARAAAATWTHVKQVCMEHSANLSTQQVAALQLALVYRRAVGL